MTTYPDPIDPNKRIPRFELAEMEQIVADSMRKAGFNPARADHFCPEIFLMEYYNLGVDFWDFPEEVRGEAVFTRKGLVAVRVNRSLDGDSKGIRLLLKSTLAHEVAGHGLHHTPFIAPDLGVLEEERTFRHRCTMDDITDAPGIPKSSMSLTRHRALEFQANYAMSCFCLPREAVLHELGNPPTDRIPAAIRQKSFDFWTGHLQAAFDTSRPMTTFRLLQIFPALQDAAARVVPPRIFPAPVQQPFPHPIGTGLSPASADREINQAAA